MKRLLSLFLAILILTTLAACLKKDDNSVDVSTSSVSSSAIASNENTSSQNSSSEAAVSSKTETSSESKTSSQTDKTNAYAPLLYKISKGNRYIYVFGSIHVGTEKMISDFPKYITNALNTSSYLAVECDIIAFERSENAQTAALSKLVYTDGSLIADNIDADVYNAAVDILTKENFYNYYLDYYMPAFWSSTIDSFATIRYGYKSENGIDRYLLEHVKKRGKEIIEIESAEEQYKMLSDFSPELQEMLLASSVSNYDSETAKNELKQLVDLWSKGKEKELTDLLEATPTMTAAEKKLYNEYQNAMMTERNKKMVRFAEEALLEGERAFICVGAAHVLGDNGIVATMERKGYKISLCTE